MKPLDLIKKIPLGKMLLGAGVLCGVGAFGTGIYVAFKPMLKVGLTHAITNAALSVHEKVVDLNRAVDENVALRIENAQLHRQIEEKVFERQVVESKKATEDKTSELIKKAGSPVARLVEGIHFEVPKSVSVSNLFTLAVSYIRAEEFEKAAKILHHLVYEQSNATYQTSENVLLLGIVLYQLDHFEGADQQFSMVLKSEASKDTLKYHAQARLWKALVAEKTHRSAKAQYWMRDLVDHHPKSIEAAWVNSDQRPVRTPASHPAEHSHEAKGEHHGEAAKAEPAHTTHEEHVEAPKHDEGEAKSHDTHGGGDHGTSHH